MKLSRIILGEGLYNLKLWLYAPNPNSDILPIDLYRQGRFSDLIELLKMPKKEPLIIISDLDPWGEEDWS